MNQHAVFLFGCIRIAVLPIVGAVAGLVVGPVMFFFGALAYEVERLKLMRALHRDGA